MLAWIFVSVLVCALSIFLLTPLANKYELVDSPGSRKRHTGNIPLIGGLAIYLSILASVLIFLDQSELIHDFLIAISVVVLIGVMDDKFELSAKIRFFMQLLVAIFLAYKTDLQLDYFGNLIGLGDIYLGIFAGPLAIFSMLVGMNAFNMMDGIDGLAASLSLVCLTAIVLITHSSNLQLIAVVVGAALLVFLAFNLELSKLTNKIFLGDAGSMMLGLIIAWFLIAASQSEIPDFKPVTALWLIAIPIIDMTSVMLKRVKRGESMLKADREHIHHVIMEMGFSSRSALIVIVSIAVLCA